MFMVYFSIIDLPSIVRLSLIVNKFSHVFRTGAHTNHHHHQHIAAPSIKAAETASERRQLAGQSTDQRLSSPATDPGM